MCVILSIPHKNNYIFEQEMFNSAPKKLMSKRWAQNDVNNDVRTNVLMSCTRSSYTPLYKTEISRRSKNCFCWVCKKQPFKTYFIEVSKNQFFLLADIEFYIGLPKHLFHRATRVLLTRKADTEELLKRFRGELDLIIETSKNPQDFKTVSLPFHISMWVILLPNLCFQPSQSVHIQPCLLGQPSK